MTTTPPTDLRPGVRAPIIVTPTSVNEANYTFEADDDYKMFDMATTATIPPHSQVPFIVGTVIYVEQSGVGTVTIAAGAGVTINALGGILTTSGQYAVIRLVQTDIDVWTFIAGGGGSSGSPYIYLDGDTVKIVTPVSGAGEDGDNISITAADGGSQVGQGVDSKGGNITIVAGASGEVDPGQYSNAGTVNIAGGYDTSLEPYGSGGNVHISGGGGSLVAYEFGGTVRLYGGDAYYSGGLFLSGGDGVYRAASVTIRGGTASAGPVNGVQIQGGFSTGGGKSGPISLAVSASPAGFDGSPITITAGAAGDQTGNSAPSQGGNITISTGAGGVTDANNYSYGGTFKVVAGVGANTIDDVAYSYGGNVYLYAGRGGTTAGLAAYSFGGNFGAYGGNSDVVTGDGSGSYGGRFVIKGGTAANALGVNGRSFGGRINITGGTGGYVVDGPSKGGPVTIQGGVTSGFNYEANGGDLNLFGGAISSGYGTTGPVLIHAGNALSYADGGNTTIRGATSDQGNAGHIVFTLGTSSGGGDPGQLVITNLPTLDPGVPGALWADGVTHQVQISP